MAEVPLTSDALEYIVMETARTLLEEWAIDDRIPADDDETIQKYTEYAVSDTATVINTYMEKFNELISQTQLNAASQSLVK